MKFESHRVASLAVAALIAASCVAVFPGCEPQQEEVARLADSFHKTVGEKESELKSLRAENLELQSRLSETEGRLKQMQVQVDASRAESKVDPKALADAIAPEVSRAVREVLANSSTPRTPEPRVPGKAHDFDFPGAQNAEAPKVQETPVKGGDDNVQRFDFDFSQ